MQCKHVIFVYVYPPYYSVGTYTLILKCPPPGGLVVVGDRGDGGVC